MGFAQAIFRARDTFGNRCLGLDQRTCDLGDTEPAQQLQRERDLRFDRQRWITTKKQQS